MLDSLQIFCLVVQHLSFSRAAAAAGLTRPAVSRHIKQLEAHFGVPLLRRTTRQIELTPAGQSLLTHAQCVLNQYRELEAAMAVFHHASKNLVVVGASTLPGEHLLPRVLAGFHGWAAENRLQVQVRIGNSDQVLQWLREGEVDLGVVGQCVPDARLAHQQLAEDEVVLAVPPAYRVPDPVPLTALRHIPLVMREPGSATRRTVLEHLQRHGIRLSDLQIVAEMSSPESVRAAVQEGMGCTFLSVASLGRGSLRAVRLQGISLRRPVCAYWRRDRPLAPAFRLLVDQMAVRSHPAAGDDGGPPP